jgi:hypothetical protein
MLSENNEKTHTHKTTVIPPLDTTGSTTLSFSFPWKANIRAVIRHSFQEEGFYPSERNRINHRATDDVMVKKKNFMPQQKFDPCCHNN